MVLDIDSVMPVIPDCCDGHLEVPQLRISPEATPRPTSALLAVRLRGTTSNRYDRRPRHPSSSDPLRKTRIVQAGSGFFQYFEEPLIGSGCQRVRLEADRSTGHRGGNAGVTCR